MIKIQAFIVAFALLILGYTVITNGDDSKPEGYYLTVGERGIAEITYTVSGGSGGCVHADGSLFEKGECVRLDLDTPEDLRISALDRNGTVRWTAAVPKMEEDTEDVCFTKDGWSIIYREEAYAG